MGVCSRRVEFGGGATGVMINMAHLSIVFSVSLSNEQTGQIFMFKSLV